MADPAPTPAEIEAARLLLAKMGVTADHLLAAPGADQPAATPDAAPLPGSRPMPTLSEWIPVVAKLVARTTAASYGSYWRKAEETWGTRRLDDITASEIRTRRAEVQDTALVRKNSRGGRNAAENFVAAMRCLYRFAEDDNLIDPQHNPARRVTKPRRQRSPRHAITDERLAEVNDTVASTGDDPELDTLILRLHEETACRRAGALNLRPRDLDHAQCLLRLREKNGTERLQPVSPTLMRHLRAHTDERGTGNPNTALLRYANGNPVTARRYDYIWTRVRARLDWADRIQLSTHWLRHTTLTWVERNFGIAVAHAYAGHFDRSDTATASYVTADITEIAQALAALTGEPHPLAPTP